MNHDMTGAHARWAVVWCVVPQKKWVVKDFENDFPTALALYTRVKAADNRVMVTLLCRNVGFPPPEHLRHRIKGYHKVLDARLGKKIRKPVYEWKLKDLNDKGILWCPYCRELRRFKSRKGYMVGDIYMPTPNISCPVCGITTENYHVRKQNPAFSHSFIPRSEPSDLPHNNNRTQGATDDAKSRKRERARLRRERAKQASA